MFFSIKYVIIPLISMFIGWITNYIAVKLLFYPEKEVRFLFMKFQGIIPKKKDKIIERLSNIIEDYLLNKEHLKKYLSKKEISETIFKEIKLALSEVVSEGVPFFKDKIMNIISVYLENKKEIVLKNLVNVIENSLEQLSIKDIVKENLNNLELNEVSLIIENLIKNELKFIELLGAILGLIIGLSQLFFI